MQNKKLFFAKDKIIGATNRWDILAMILVVGLIIGFAWVTKQMTAPYQLGQALPISLEPSALPVYALRTVARMLFALLLSLLFSFVFATWAAKNKHAERIIIPAIDVLQSVPILGFLSIVTPAFIAIFHGSMLGPECAAIFVIFTSQAWNIALGFYQSQLMVPNDLKEASAMLQLSSWQRFWHVEVPFAMPSLVWNTMMSMSASWFFVVASEAISINNQKISLPGVGSYIALAISRADSRAVCYAIVAMFIVILLYDQLLFRPIIAWSEKFRAEQSDFEPKMPLIIRILRHTHVLAFAGRCIAVAVDAFINNRWCNSRHKAPTLFYFKRAGTIFIIAWYIFLFSFVTGVIFLLWNFIFQTISLHEALHVIFLGAITGLRVLCLIMLCSLIWVPIGVWVGLRPRVSNIVQPIAQFLAAFPANLLFPVVVMFIVTYHLNVEIWTSHLMILGTQWYILFNVIAGIRAMPKELYYAAANFGVSGWLWWRRLILPSVFPFFITGALTASGGAWNASIVAEVVTWGNTTLKAQGIGAYIADYTTHLDYPRIALGICVLCIYVITLNRLVWRPLYKLAENRFQGEL